MNPHNAMLAQVLSAAYSPAQPDQQRQEARISGLYLMMGSSLERLQVRPGVLCCLRSSEDFDRTA